MEKVFENTEPKDQNNPRYILEKRDLGRGIGTRSYGEQNFPPRQGWKAGVGKGVVAGVPVG
jgi:hypothetical protein